jgi:hypothetical protein
MIFTKYYAWIPKETRNDGSAMMRAYESVQGKSNFIVDGAEVTSKREPKSSPLTKKDSHPLSVSP